MQIDTCKSASKAFEQTLKSLNILCQEKNVFVSNMRPKSRFEIVTSAQTMLYFFTNFCECLFPPIHC